MGKLLTIVVAVVDLVRSSHFKQAIGMIDQGFVQDQIIVFVSLVLKDLSSCFAVKAKLT